MRYLKAVVVAAVLALGTGEVEAGHRDVRFVEKCYRQYLGRCADPAGLREWVRQLDCGASPLAVEVGILASEEYWCRRGHNPEGFVSGLYEDVLGRTPCRREIHDWVCKYNRCGCRKTLARDFLKAARAELEPAPVRIGFTAYLPRR